MNFSEHLQLDIVSAPKVYRLLKQMDPAEGGMADSDQSTDKKSEELTDDVSPSSNSRGFQGTKDRWGFLVSDEFHRHLQLTPEEVALRKEKESERALKWVKMKGNWNKYCATGPKYAKMKRRARKGIPDSVRGFAWFQLCGAMKVKKKFPNPWAIDTKGVSETVIDEIGRDVDRTFPQHEMFYHDGGPGQESLRRLLTWYAALDPEVGYCQGMGFIAALLLSYMIEEDAFYCLYAVLTRPSAPLRLLYLPRMEETQKVLFVFGELGEKFLPKLWTHLNDEGIHHTMYFTEWALTLFSRGFSFDLVTRVWDVLMNEGSYKIVYRVSLGILKYFEQQLLELKFDKIMALLRDLPRHIDANKLMEVTWSVPLKTEDVTQAETKYAESLSQKAAIAAARMVTSSKK